SRTLGEVTGRHSCVLSPCWRGLAGVLARQGWRTTHLRDASTGSLPFVAEMYRLMGRGGSASRNQAPLTPREACWAPLPAPWARLRAPRASHGRRFRDTYSC